MKILIAAAVTLLLASPVIAQTNNGASGLNAPAPQSNNADQSTSPKGVTPNSTWYDGPALTNKAGEKKTVTTIHAQRRQDRVRDQSNDSQH